MNKQTEIAVVVVFYSSKILSKSTVIMIMESQLLHERCIKIAISPIQTFSICKICPQIPVFLYNTHTHKAGQTDKVINRLERK